MFDFSFLPLLALAHFSISYICGSHAAPTIQDVEPLKLMARGPPPYRPPLISKSKAEKNGGNSKVRQPTIPKSREREAKGPQSNNAQGPLRDPVRLTPELSLAEILSPQGTNSDNGGSPTSSGHATRPISPVQERVPEIQRGAARRIERPRPPPRLPTSAAISIPGSSKERKSAPISSFGKSSQLDADRRRSQSSPLKSGNSSPRTDHRNINSVRQTSPKGESSPSIGSILASQGDFPSLADAPRVAKQRKHETYKAQQEVIPEIRPKKAWSEMPGPNYDSSPTKSGLSKWPTLPATEADDSPPKVVIPFKSASKPAISKTTIASRFNAKDDKSSVSTGVAALSKKAKSNMFVPTISNVNDLAVHGSTGKTTRRKQSRAKAKASKVVNPTNNPADPESVGPVAVSSSTRGELSGLADRRSESGTSSESEDASQSLREWLSKVPKQRNRKSGSQIGPKPGVVKKDPNVARMHQLFSQYSPHPEDHKAYLEQHFPERKADISKLFPATGSDGAREAGPPKSAEILKLPKPRLTDSEEIHTIGGSKKDFNNWLEDTKDFTDELKPKIAKENAGLKVITETGSLRKRPQVEIDAKRIRGENELSLRSHLQSRRNYRHNSADENDRAAKDLKQTLLKNIKANQDVKEFHSAESETAEDQQRWSSVLNSERAVARCVQRGCVDWAYLQMVEKDNELKKTYGNDMVRNTVEHLKRPQNPPQHVKAYLEAHRRYRVTRKTLSDSESEVDLRDTEFPLGR